MIRIFRVDTLLDEGLNVYPAVFVSSFLSHQNRNPRAEVKTLIGSSPSSVYYSYVSIGCQCGTCGRQT